MAEDNQPPQQKGQDQTPPKPPTPPPIPNDENYEEIDRESATPNFKVESNPVFKIPQPFSVEVKEKQWYLRAEVIAFFALLVSIYAVALNQCTYYSAEHALALTDSTFQASKRYDSMNRINDRIRDSMGYIKDTTLISLATKTLKSYVDNLNDNQRRFQIENRPLLQVTEFTLDTSQGIQNTSVAYDVVNTGKYPARIISVKNGGTFGISGITEKEIDERLDSMHYTNTYNYISTFNGAGFRIPGFTFSRRLLDLYKSEQASIHVYGTMRCINLATNKKFSVSYIYRIKYGNAAEAIRNKEYPGWVK